MANYLKKTLRKRGRPRKTVKEVKSSNSQRRREKILAISNSLFRIKGYLGTSVQDIADKAKVNKSTIYNYYKNKHSLMYESANKDLNTLINIAKTVENSCIPPNQKLELIVFNHIKWRAENFGFQIARVDQNYLTPKLLYSYIFLRDEYEGIFRKVIGEIIAQGRPQYLNTKIASLLVLGLANSINQWFRPNGELSSDEIAKTACGFILRALEIYHT